MSSPDFSVYTEKAKAFLQTFSDLDIDTNLSFRTKEAEHWLAPVSMAAPPNNKFTSEQWSGNFANVIPLISSIPITIKDLVAGTSAVTGKPTVTIWWEGKSLFRPEIVEKIKSVGGEIEQVLLGTETFGEFVFVLTFESEGEEQGKMSKIVEFVDVERFKAVFAAIGKLFAPQN